jgi:predicted dinucleotide-binding enzyme
MRIGILGAGRIGGTAAGLFARAGHDVRLSGSHGPGALRDEVAQLGPGVEAATPADAVAFGDVVLLAVPWPAAEAAVPAAGPYDGKIVIDAMNGFGADGPIDFGDRSSSEIVAQLVPGARVVKAFNTMRSSRLADEGRPDGDPERLAMFVAGDDVEAKELVSGLIAQVGFDPVDSGGLLDGGRRQQPGSPLFNVAMTREQAERELAKLAG